MPPLSSRSQAAPAAAPSSGGTPRLSSAQTPANPAPPDTSAPTPTSVTSSTAGTLLSRVLVSVSTGLSFHESETEGKFCSCTLTQIIKILQFTCFLRSDHLNIFIHLNIMMLVVFSAAAAVAQTPVTPVTPASVGSPPPHQPIQLSDLQSILANMNVPAAAAAAQGPGG